MAKSVTSHTRADGGSQTVNRDTGKFDDRAGTDASSASDAFSDEEQTPYLKELDALEEKTPREADERLVEIWGELSSLNHRSSGLSNQLRWKQETLDRHLAFLEQRGEPENVLTADYRQEFEQAKEKLDALEPNRERITDLLEAHRDNFAANDGWTRVWLVTDGHAHRSTNCSTCFPTTEFSLVTDYSGADDAEIVGDAGSRACTVCYPDAPVEREPGARMLTPTERERAQKRAELEAKRSEKAQKAAEKAIVAADGGVLITGIGRRYPEKIKTETAARTKLKSTLFDLMHGMSNADYQKELAADADRIVAALAAKHGVEPQEIVDDVMTKFRKTDRDHREVIDGFFARGGSIENSLVNWKISGS